MMLRSSTPDAVVLTLGDEFIFLGGLFEEEVLSLIAVSNISGLKNRKGEKNMVSKNIGKLTFLLLLNFLVMFDRRSENQH